MAVNFFPEDSGSSGSGGGGTGNYIPLTQKGSANGVATLDASAKVPSSQLPDISITNTFVVATEVEMLALNAQTGDIAVRTDVNKTFILKTSPASVVGNWVELPTPTNGVFSVDGKTGAVTLTNTYQAKSNELTALSSLTDTPGFIKKVGDGVYAVDTTAYLSTIDASIFYQPLNANLTSIGGVTGTYGFLVKTVNGWELNTFGYQHASPLLTGIANLTGDGYLEKVGAGWALNPGPFQPLDINLTGISAIDADGFLTRTGGVWAMDSNRYQYANNELSGFSALPDEVGLVKKTGDGTYELDKSTYLTVSSSIAMTGDVTGTGTNSNIVTTLASITTGKTATKVTFNNKGLVISGTTLSDTDLPTHSHTVTLTGDVTGSGSNSSITTALPTITSANTATKITYTAKGLVTGGTTLSDTDLPPHPHTVTVTGDIAGTGSNSALTLTLPNIATAGTYPKVTVNAKGQVTSGSALLASDIPNLDWAKITTGKPTTIGGYGITDAYTKLEIDGSLSNKQNLSNELTALSSLADTVGFIRKTGDGTYAIDTNVYLTTSTASSSYQPLNTNLTGVSGLTGLDGIARKTGGVWSLDASNYLTGNQTITLSGDVSGAGTTAITVTLPNVVTAGSSAKPIYNAKGLITGSGSLLAADIPSLDWSKIATGKPTTLGGYGLTGDAYTKTQIDSFLGQMLPLTGGALTGELIGRAGITLEADSFTPLSLTNLSKTEAGLSTRYVFYNMKSTEPGGTNSNCFCIYSYNNSSVKSVPFVISDTDNIGIGTLAPTTKLQVVGAISASNISLTASTPSTSTTTGTVVVPGGIGVQGNQYIGGFSSFGGDASHPPVKIKRLTGTTSSTQGGTASIAHGLTTAKIIHISAVVAQTTGQLMCNGFQSLSGYQFDVADNGTSIIIYNHPTNSSNILSKAVTITIIYTQ